MSINLIDLVTKGLSGNLMSQLGTVIGTNQESASRSIASAVPAILGGLLKTSSTQTGASDLVSLLINGKHDGLVSNLNNTLGGGAATENLLKTGASLLPSVFGDRAHAVTSLVGSASGISQASAVSLMSIAGPLVMGFITQHLHSTGGLSVSSLLGLLNGQKSAIAASAPAGLAGALGLASLDAGIAPAHPNLTAPVVDTPTSNGWIKWVIGLAAILAALFALRTCQTQKSEVGTAVVTPPVEAPAVAPVTTPVPVATPSGAVSDGLISLTLPDGIVIKAAQEGVEGKLVAFITDSSKVVDKTTWFTMDRLEFATGSATLQGKSDAQLDNIAAILKAFPNVKLKVGGYTDSSGNADKNLKLSADRASVTLAALSSRNIDATRLEAEGYGDKFPVADNATEEGKQRNRRTDLHVTQK